MPIKADVLEACRDVLSIGDNLHEVVEEAGHAGLGIGNYSEYELRDLAAEWKEAAGKLYALLKSNA